MEPNPLIELIHHGREERYLEYKTSIDWNTTEVKAKLTKTVLAMANIRDGGAIVIGVREEDEQYVPEGMLAEHVASFTQDGVSAHVDEFADPFVELTVSQVAQDDKNFVLIQVKEFADLPVVCRRDGLQNLRCGAVYTRPRRMHETAEVRSQTEMREILDMALEKRLRAQHELLQQAGLTVTQAESDAALFDEQLGAL